MWGPCKHKVQRSDPGEAGGAAAGLPTAGVVANSWSGYTEKPGRRNLELIFQCRKDGGAHRPYRSMKMLPSASRSAVPCGMPASPSLQMRCSTCPAVDVSVVLVVQNACPPTLIFRGVLRLLAGCVAGCEGAGCRGVAGGVLRRGVGERILQPTPQLTHSKATSAAQMERKKRAQAAELREAVPCLPAPTCRAGASCCGF